MKGRNVDGSVVIRHVRVEHRRVFIIEIVIKWMRSLLDERNGRKLLIERLTAFFIVFVLCIDIVARAEQGASTSRSISK